ncbi:MAG: ATP-binding protein [Micrococcales bacterium]|nr:ATP-binding protein [Micrococcales bacterium]
MRRTIEARLARWAQTDDALPLVLLGARQVGKTYSARQLGADRFAKTAYVNFQTDLARLTRVFDGVLDPWRIVEDLGLLLGVPITPGDTLVVLDEVQLCQPALTALKYFAEQAPGLRVVATGSLFGVTVHREPRFSFPVGKVEIATMHPMTFEEYCWATGRDTWPDAIRACLAEDRPFVAHDEALAQLRRYLMVGGMPAAVERLVTSGDWDQVRQVQGDIAHLYAADASLYLDDATAARVRAIWDSAPRQLARQNRKFKLADMAKGARAEQYEAAFAWLENAGLVHRHRLVEQPPSAPLRPVPDGTFFKTYLADVGLLSQALGVRPQVYLDDDARRVISSVFHGALAQNLVKQSLEAAGVASGYWTSGNTAEVDFLVVDDQMRVLPLEVKSADNVRSKSLGVYAQRHHPPYAVRCSTKQFGREPHLRSVPLYATFCLDDILRST